MPIGGVLACKDVIVPNAVGRDIGCGMSTTRSSLAEIGREDLKKIMAFLPMDTPIARQYKKEMEFCVEFAFCNRILMIERMKECIRAVLGEPVKFDPLINIAHNYAKEEKHFGERVIVYRKGATSAMHGEKGIIPGSQGTNSYVVEGLGNTESFHSCSHGAGRQMGRKQAQLELDLAEEIRKLDEKGVLHAVRGKYDLDEAAGAYKPIDEVMENQRDLVKILIELEPLAVVKG
jgi:tRNA-splicing ligase RtcB